MIGTIRKHSAWLWWFIAVATVVSFIFWGLGPSARVGGGMAPGDRGSLYGQKITDEDYENCKREFYIFYWFQSHNWPDKNPSFTAAEMDQQIYLRLMLSRKAKSLGIHVSDDSAAGAAMTMLNRVNDNGQPLSVRTFEQQILEQEYVDGRPLDDSDFERFIRDDLGIEQLMEIMGMAGNFITPGQAADMYRLEHQEFRTHAVFFSASNYLAKVPVTPAIIGRYYTNYMAQYRLPDRVQVRYVEFSATNFMAQARRELTNINDLVESAYLRVGPDYFADAKTPAAAKAKIRGILLQKQALADAAAVANGLATEVYNMQPQRAANLATLAKKKGLAVRTTQPFDREYGPSEFPAPAEFVKDAFDLTPDSPFAGPVAGDDAVYDIALYQTLPEEIPPLDSIRDRVTLDYQTMQATLLARRMGADFYKELTNQLSSGKTYSAACAAAGLRATALPPFSLSSQDVPGAAERTGLWQLKRTALATPPGKAADFQETQDGGFILFVDKISPVNQATMAADMPEFIAQARHERVNDIFNEWLHLEVNRQFVTTPIYKSQANARPPAAP